MFKKIILSFSLAIQNIRARLFHTLLSILGIVIGVAALVTVLSLIDGMEKYARDQITNTTSLKAVLIQTEIYKRVNNVRLQKENYNYLDYERFTELDAAMPYKGIGYIQYMHNGEIRVGEKQLGATINGVNAIHPTAADLQAGRLFTADELSNKSNVAFVTHYFAEQAVGKDSLAFILGQTVNYKDRIIKVIGVLKPDKAELPQVFMPISLFPAEEVKDNPPRVIFEVDDVVQVPAFKKEVENWLKTNYSGDPSDFVVITNEGRVEQAVQGFLLFRVIMGLIVGISVVVGGIGVMNVLLISVTERTVEIGVRKAMGAKKRDILMQFLAESVTVSLFGSLLGLVLGVVATLGIVPIVKAMVEVPFQAAYTFDTFIIIAVIAVIIGVLFGTYPATRAARLDPVEAIRRE